MNSLARRRPPLAKGRRISINVNLAPDVHKALAKIAGGNKSAAIEELVRRHLDDCATYAASNAAITQIA